VRLECGKALLLSLKIILAGLLTTKLVEYLAESHGNTLPLLSVCPDLTVAKTYTEILDHLLQLGTISEPPQNNTFLDMESRYL
jgi:hypothetical protein